MQGETKVIEFLNAGLRHELTAVNQYWLHYRLLEHWGYKDLAAVWRKESIEEMQHADRLIARILFLEGSPTMLPEDSLRIGQTVKEVMESDLGAEMSARALYSEAATHCHAVADYVSRRLFEDLLNDEEGHIDFLETQIELIDKLGPELYGQKRLGGLSHD
jgi:bacterioferritin